MNNTDPHAPVTTCIAKHTIASPSDTPSARSVTISLFKHETACEGFTAVSFVADKSYACEYYRSWAHDSVTAVDNPEAHHTFNDWAREYGLTCVDVPEFDDDFEPIPVFDVF
jgi:hypothetical protein